MNHVHCLITTNYRSVEEALSANTSPIAGVTSNEAKIRMDSPKRSAPVRRLHRNNEPNPPLGRIFCPFPEGGRAELGKRRAQLERMKQELGKRSLELQAVAGQVMSLKQELAEQTNVSTASTKREAHIRRLSRDQSAILSRDLPAVSARNVKKSQVLSRDLPAVSARNVKKSPLGKKKKDLVSKPVGNIQFSAASKPPKSIQFFAAPSLENDEVAFCSEIEQTTALKQQQNATSLCSKREALMRRLSRNLSAVCARNIVKEPLGKKKNAVSKKRSEIVCCCNCGCCAV
jgi:hypothetical protein